MVAPDPDFPDDGTGDEVKRSLAKAAGRYGLVGVILEGPALKIYTEEIDFADAHRRLGWFIRMLERCMPMSLWKAADVGLPCTPRGVVDLRADGYRLVYYSMPDTYGRPYYLMIRAKPRKGSVTPTSRTVTKSAHTGRREDPMADTVSKEVICNDTIRNGRTLNCAFPIVLNALATRVCHLQGGPDSGKGTKNLQIDEMSETLSAALDVLAHEYPMADVVLELERRKALRPVRPGGSALVVVTAETLDVG